MQNILFGGAQKAANGIVDEFSKRPSRALSLRVHNQKGEKKGQKKAKFTFKPDLPLEQQFAQLEIYALQHNRRRLQIKGFKGTFKIENWINIETKLRNMQGLKAIGFIDTQLDKVHLDVLSRWLSWVDPQKLIIELQQNELDNEDVAEFLYFLFERNIDVRSIYIMGNPGIYKGVLLKELNDYLFKKFEKNMIHYYKLIKNKQALSVAIIRLLRRKNDEAKSKRIHRAEVKIDQTQYYKLQLKNCFTDKNWKGFQDLIQTTYKEDNLEQLTYLDISNNFLGTQNAFNNMCTSMSSAKGLLVLKIANQPLIHNSQTIELLMGNRYDNLKLREFDISDNKDMLEKTFKALSDNIFKFCKIITFTGSMPQQLSTLFKMFVLTEAFADKTKESKQIYREKKYFRKDYLQILDLSSIENYNRHDLVEKLLLNTVFTEFTNIRTLHVQNFDVGRCQGYVKAKKKFLTYMEKKKQDDTFFKNYKHPLKHIVYPKQTYRMEIQTKKEFFLEYLFTEKGSIIEIETIIIQSSTFRQANRAEGLQEACALVIEKTNANADVRYSIKKISMDDSDYQMNYQTLQCFLCLASVQLEEFSYSNDSMTFEWDVWYQEMKSYCTKLQTDQFHSLKTLKLQNISDMYIEINQFIELLVFNPKIQLKELVMIDVYTSNIQENYESLKSIVDQSGKVTLEKLALGELQAGQGEEMIFEQVIFNKRVQLKSLVLKNVKLQQFLNKIEKLVEENIHDNPLQFLTYLEIDKINIQQKEDWRKVIQIFIINQRLSLQLLKIKNTVLNQQFSEILNQLLFPFEQELFNIIKSKKETAGMVIDLNEQNMLSQIQNESIGLPFVLYELNYENCTIQDDVLSGFLVICELKNLSFINCQDLKIGIKKSMEIIKRLELDQYYSYKIKSFSCERTEIQDVETFQSLIKEIALNSNRQLLEMLNLDSCALNDEMMQALSKQLMAIKEEQKLYNRVFLLRDLNLNNNNKISVSSWQQLWDVILNESKLEKKEEAHMEQSITEKENIINETQKLIETSQLFLKEKILYNYKKFTPQFPKQITSLVIRMDFKTLNDNELKYEYYRLIVGFIIHPESELKTLELESLNMIVFIKACIEAFEFSKYYLESALKQSKHDHKSQIKSVTIKSLTANDAESTEKFIQIFLCSTHIELSKLSVFGCTQPILHLILKNIDRKEVYQLEELSLPDLEETLDLEDTINYCQWLVFGQRMPIKKLSSCPNLADMNQEQFNQFNLSKVKVESINLKYKQDTSSNVKQYSLLLAKLILNGLQEITIDKSDTTSIIVETFNKVNNLDNLKLKKLIFKGDFKLNKNLFEKISKLFEKLEFFQVQKLLLENEFEIYDICQLMDVHKTKNLKFDIKSVTCNNPGEFYKKFLFNPNVGITEIILKDPQLLENKFDIYELGQKIRYFNLNMGLLYNSSTQLNVNALQIISKMLIYNESSNLEELVLHQCHFKLAGIEALCKYSNSLREKIKSDGREKTAQLKLNRITLYYSLYIGDDGVQKYVNDLLYFEYINIERFEVQVTNWNDAMTNSLCLAAQNWFQFQKDKQRQYSTKYPIKYIDIGRNEFIEEQETWSNFLKTFVFTDNTPDLETLNIHFMALNDLKTRYLIAEALQFFSKKPSNYKFNVKKVNFSQNNSLTHLGWQNLFKNFFFHPKVYLEELNMISTMLDSQIKLDVIAQVIKERALDSPNKKVPLHTFLCYNVSLKDYIADYLSEQPQNYQTPYDIPVEIEYNNSLNFGYFDGVPEAFGDILQMFQRILKTRQNIVYIKDWKLTRSKYSPYHLNMCDHYLNILNQYYTTKKNDLIDICISLQSLDNFANYFGYITEYPGSPYPYNLLFQQNSFNYFKEKSCNIFKIKIIQTEFAELEQINQFQILNIWNHVKHSSTSIDQIQVEYDLNDDLVDEMFRQGFDERDIISLIRLIPPSKIRIQNSLSIQAIKGIYSILYDTYYFKYAMISYSFDNFLNIGIGYSLREVFYNYKAVGPIRKFFKIAFYKFFNFFVIPTKRYIFNDEVKRLNDYLSQQKFYFFIIVITNILFFVITLAGPYLLTYKLLDRDAVQLTKNYICANGTSKEASYLYYSFAFITLITEAILYYKVAQIVPNHTQRIIVSKITNEKEQNEENQQQPDGQIQEKHNNKVLPSSEEDASMLKKQKQTQNQSQNFDMGRHSILQKMATAVNKKITQYAGKFTTAVTAQAEEFTQSKWGILLSYGITLLSSQLFKFDLYNDVVFILNAYNCEEFIVFILALITTAFSQGIYILQFFYLISVRVVQNQKTAKLLSSKFINDFYAISFLGRNAALSTLLDSSAPFNVIIIPNTRIGRYFLPHHAGKAMSNLVKSYFFQFLCEDLPQTLLQMYFVVSQAIRRTKELQVQVYISICTAILTALLSFYKFLSIRPTNLLQENFDELSSKLSSGYNQLIQNNLQQENDQIKTYIDLYNTVDYEIVNVEQSQEERQSLLN
ncbi:unnamed protein product (macronuclear) [Paramecium tetraurelia]|uniref:Uncharacterized protein n=1 Tax=Paramecium tetraurelia TaxID=5888 RepID=A0BQ88_PARTE|nr:uncharacterized protein GSPATT00030934001 [Paramecium tetraurelia]CAK60705.1 unnamed protein product [Paramecium tetraurelia]|eukprot:XP_001428103.1 hypothetical protein (macronuclear) [Paramecium tetraurelia strain d4-2]